MKKLLFLCLLLVPMFLVVPGYGVADVVTLSRDVVNPSGGGPFTAVISGVTTGPFSNGDSFTTFCLEKNEFFSPGHPYEFTISNGAVEGGNGGQEPVGSTFDPLSEATAWLYSSLLRGSLDGMLFGGTVFDSSVMTHLYAVQDAVWDLEDEIDLSSGFAYELVATAQTEAAKAPGNFYGVVALNLVDGSGNPVQSQLAMVPLPSCLILVGTGLCGVAVSRYRKRKEIA